MMIATLTADAAHPLLVFGGPYSNLQATRAIRSEADRLAIPPGNVVCTGDVVAYAARPEETAALIRAWGIAVVAGNCEVQLGVGADDCGCGFEEGSACDRLSHGWYPFTLANTSAATRSWMAGLPGRVDINFAGLRIAALHGGAHHNNRFLFASETEALEAEYAAAAADRPCDVVVAGHAGLPFAALLDRGAWINAGVIGMPANDGTPDGWYALLTSAPGGLDVSLHRLAYDYVSAAAEMRRSGHTNGYARCLVTGLWPSLDVLPATERRSAGEALAEHRITVMAEAVAG